MFRCKFKTLTKDYHSIKFYYFIVQCFNLIVSNYLLKDYILIKESYDLMLLTKYQILRFMIFLLLVRLRIDWITQITNSSDQTLKLHMNLWILFSRILKGFNCVFFMYRLITAFFHILISMENSTSKKKHNRENFVKKIVNSLIKSFWNHLMSQTDVVNPEPYHE